MYWPVLESREATAHVEIDTYQVQSWEDLENLFWGRKMERRKMTAAFPPSAGRTAIAAEALQVFEVKQSCRRVQRRLDL
jgi:hypothetical protein